MAGLFPWETDNKDSLAQRILMRAGYGGLGLWNAIGGGYHRYDYDTSGLSPEVQKYLNNLSQSELEQLEEDYYVKRNNAANMWGIGGYDRYELDTESLLNDLQQLGTMAGEYNALKTPMLEDYLASARAEADAKYAGMRKDLDALDAERLNMHEAEMRNLQTGYDQLRSNLLTSQYQQNAQLMDTLQSGMERSRRNALEAGASAGIRIADNINTLLSVQNKQSATSMETANQLSQMMINQRNAEAESRRNYSDYVTQSTANRHALGREQESYAQNLANTNYTAAQQSHAAKQQELDNKYAMDNPLYSRRGAVSSYYNK